MLRTALLRAALLRGRLRGSRLLNRGARSLRIRCLNLRSQASRRHTRRTSSRHTTLRRSGTSRNRTSTRSHAALQNLQARSQRRNLRATGGTLHRRQKQTSTQQLQLKLRIRRTRHTIQSLIRRTRSNRQLTLTQSLSLLSQTLQLILRNTLQNLAGSLRNSLHHDQITQTLQQILHKTARILTGRHHTRHRAKESRRILRAQRLNDLIQKLRVGITQQCHRTVILNTALRRRTSHQLIKNRQRITHRTATSTNHQLQHTRLNRHLLLIAQALQERQKNLRRNQTERVMVSTRTNRTQHLIRLSRREDKLHMLRRLLHNLQQRIETLTGHHMRLINNEDLVTVTHRRQSSALTQITGMIHTAVARRIHLNHVKRTATITRELTARIAHTTRSRSRTLRTVQATRQNTRRRGLTATTRTRKQVRVIHAVLLQSDHKRFGHVLLPNNLSKGLGAITTIKGSAHGNLFNSGVRIGQSLPF